MQALNEPQRCQSILICARLPHPNLDRKTSMKMTVKIWEQHVAAARQQKVSTKTYANQHDLSPSIFYYCQRKLQANANVRGVSRQIRPSQHTSKFVALRVASAHIVSTQCPSYFALF